MGEKRFSIKEALDFSWNIVKANFQFWLLLLVLGYVISVVPSNIAGWLAKQKAWGWYILFALGGLYASCLVQLGWAKIVLSYYDGKKAGLADFFFAKPVFILRFLGGVTLCSLAVLGGLIFLIVPGILFGIRFGFYTFLMADRNLKVLDSMQTSWELTRGQTWPLFVLGLAILGINILGFLCFLVGLAWTIPLTMIMLGYVYRKFVPAGAR